jgi:hypothetical protein
MSHSVDKGRRRSLVTAATVVTATGFAKVLPGYGAGGAMTTTGPAQLTVADVPVGAHVRPAGANYIVARDQAGLFAHSNVCTHEGCEVPTPDTNGVSVCPCHLARFDAQVQGAGDSARIVVDTSTVESNRAARTPVPEGQPASDAGMADGATV